MPKPSKVKIKVKAGDAGDSQQPIRQQIEQHDRPHAAAVADQLHSAAIHLLRHLREEDWALELGPAQLSALSVLVFAGPQTIGALARKEQVAAPTISRLIDALVDAGLARRKPGRDDRRSVQVCATAAGTRLMQKGRTRRVARLESMLTGLPAAELQTIAEASRLLAALLRR